MAKSMLDKLHKFSLPASLLILIVLLVILSPLFPSGCAENFSSGAPLNYKMETGVLNGWQDMEKDSWNSSDWFKHLEGNTGGAVPLPENQLAFFYKNKFDPSCCPSTYTSSTGCACESPEQAKYLNQRGGNRTLTSEF
tara:strand:+ start:685 stop:1098 length:414 start_codon:yes stop_codon:yes gene_type:complete